MSVCERQVKLWIRIRLDIYGFYGLWTTHMDNFFIGIIIIAGGDVSNNSFTMKNKIELERELVRINKLIDKKIIRGESYQKESAIHLRIRKLLTV